MTVDEADAVQQQQRADPHGGEGEQLAPVASGTPGCLVDLRHEHPEGAVQRDPDPPGEGEQHEGHAQDDRCQAEVFGPPGTTPASSRPSEARRSTRNVGGGTGSATPAAVPVLVTCTGSHARRGGGSGRTPACPGGRKPGTGQGRSLMSGAARGTIVCVMTETTAPPQGPPSGQPQAGQLYRDPDNSMFGGVCTAVARYTNTDP